jgi:hypothetical protein
LAKGMSEQEASAVTGYDPSRISVLKSDPAFRDLVAHYQRQEDALAADFSERASMVTLTALAVIQDKLESEDDPVSLSAALEVAKTFADRTGHAPIQKSVQMNVNVDFAERLKAAQTRLRLRNVTPGEV